MAFDLHRPGLQLPIVAASNLAPRSVVKLGASSPLQILSVASNNDRPFGVLGAATAPRGVAAAVYEEGNVVKAIAGASLGAGAEVAVATIGVATNIQGGSLVATVTQLGPIAGASGVAAWAVGIALDAVAAGEVFSLYVKPRLTGGVA